MPRIFLSFRKVDERVGRDRVYRALVAAFGADRVFRSGASIPPGADYAQVLLHEAAACEVMLVLIGPGWLDASDDDGRRLLFREHDWVRREIATSLRAGNTVIPVLLGDTTMLPDAADLPADLARLSRAQFVRIEQSGAETGLGKLVSSLQALLPGLPQPEPPETSTPSAAGPSRQTARASQGGVALNIGGNLHADHVRIIGRTGPGV